MRRARHLGGWTVALAGLFLGLSGCGGTPRVPPPGVASPPPGSVVLHLAGTTYAAPLYGEIGSRISTTGVVVDYQSLDSPADGLLRRPGLAGVSALSSSPLGDLPRVRDTAQVYVPVAFSAVAVLYDLPGLRRPLRLRGSVLAAIYQERIKVWNDRRIRADNRGVALPGLPITVLHRAGAGQLTDLFTRYLAAASPRWRRHTGSGAAVNWPAGTAVPDDGTMRQVLRSTPGAIGYTDAATAAQDHLRTAQLRAAGGTYAAPTPRATALAGRAAGPGLDGATIATRVPGAYPIAAELGLLTLRDPCAAGGRAAEATGLRRMVLYLLGPGQSVVRRFGLAPLSPELGRRARRAAAVIGCRAG